MIQQTNIDDHDKLSPHVSFNQALQLIFWFEDKEPLPYDKEKIEDTFVEIDMHVLESHTGFTNPSVYQMQSECHKLDSSVYLLFICRTMNFSFQFFFTMLSNLVLVHHKFLKSCVILILR